MSKQIVINSGIRQKRAAILKDNVLEDILIETDTYQQIASNIYRGKVKDVLAGMQAAFVDIGIEKNAFLHISDAYSLLNSRQKEKWDNNDLSIKEVLQPGQEIMVQVTKEPIGSKGAKVTCKVSLPGRYLVLLPFEKRIGVSRRIKEEDERNRLKKITQELTNDRFGAIVRTNAFQKSMSVLAHDYNYLTNLWHEIQQRYRSNKAPSMIYKNVELIKLLVRDYLSSDIDKVIIDSDRDYEKLMTLTTKIVPELENKIYRYTRDTPIFESYEIEKEFKKIYKRKIWLDSGGYIIIDFTEALVSIDVNTGKYVGKQDLQNTVFKTNKEAAREIARQLKLRDIGGIIIIDFIEWDLCAQAIKYEDFIAYLDKWSQEKVKIQKAETKNEKSFVDVLIYLCVNNSDELCIFVQHKTCTSSDRWYECEGSGMSLGNDIFIFDVGENLFTSIICSDILNYELSEHIIELIRQNNIILFHPQLNPSPRHREFRLFRDRCFKVGGHNFKLITLNWSIGTTMTNGNNIETFKSAWSAFFKKEIKMRFEDEEHRKLRRKNHNGGLYYAKYNYIDIWYTYPHEENINIFIIKPVTVSNVIHEGGVEPVSEEILLFDINDNRWISDVERIKSNNLKRLQSKISNYFDCISDYCNYNFPIVPFLEPDMCDYFFALCFGHTEENELKTSEEETVNRCIMAPDEEAESNMRSKLRLYADLVKILNNREKFPLHLGDIKSNHRIGIYRLPDEGEVYINLFPNDCDLQKAIDEKKVALVAITNNFDLIKVKQKISFIVKKLPDDLKDRGALYYIDGDGGYKYIGSSEISYSNSERAKKEEDILKGGE